jgi:Uma2 family endonuclease
MPQPETRFSFAEYLLWQQQQPERAEFVDGQIRQMAGGSKRHNRLALRMARLLEDAFPNCAVYASDVLLHVRWNDKQRGYYPDVLLVCESEDDERIVRNPCVIVEVLSDSTQSIDQREKLWAYSQLPSLQHYVLVSQDLLYVRHHARNQQWQPRILVQPEASLYLDCPPESPQSLSIQALYQGLGLEPHPPQAEDEI